jgi:dolichol-phosphate mannosyltransferase
VLIERLVVVMPAYNEATGIAGFVGEILAELRPLAAAVSVIVIDDCSSDGTSDVVGALSGGDVRVRRNAVNRGHGPSALAGYRAALEDGADVVVHVDGDGQFRGQDIALVAATLAEVEVDVVHGVRRHRSDPWYRRLLSAALRLTTLPVARRSIPDLNTPLRAYRPDVLSRLVAEIPDSALVPHVHLSVLEARRGLRVRYVPVRSLPRRGGDAQGTSWGGGRWNRMLPTRRLVTFVRRALVEFVRIDLARAASAPSRKRVPR